MKLNYTEKCCENKSNSSYIKRILRMIGPVILGSKPVEIINIPGGINEKEIKIYQIKSFFNNCCKITYRVINTCRWWKKSTIYK